MLTACDHATYACGDNFLPKMARAGRIFSNTIKLMLERPKSAFYQQEMLLECAKITLYQQDMPHQQDVLLERQKSTLYQQEMLIESAKNKLPAQQKSHSTDDRVYFLCQTSCGRIKFSL